MNRARITISILTTSIVLVGVTVPAGAFTASSVSDSTTDPTLVGEWSPPFAEDPRFDDHAPETRDESKAVPVGANIAVSPDGMVIYWNGTEGWEDLTFSSGGGPDTPTEKNRTRLLDLRDYLQGKAARPSWITPRQEFGIGHDLFCGDLRNLADGRLLVVGGTRWEGKDDTELGFKRTYVWGVDDARIYDPRTAEWTEAERMNHARWYPSLLTLPDGKMLVAGGVREAGYNEDLRFVNETETFDPTTGTWTDNGPDAATALPYYGRLHLLPNGKVFYGANGQMYGPAPILPPRDMVEWNLQKVYDPKQKLWTSLGLAPFGGRSGSFSVMLPLKPGHDGRYDGAQILIGGGTLAPNNTGTYLATNLTEIVTATGDSITREVGPTLNTPRWHSSAVVLPSGEVIALNGGDRDETVFPGITRGARQTEMYDPEENKWVPLSPSSRDRVYHHTGILLADGSVLVGGHAPVGLSPFLLRPDNYTHGAFASTLKDPSFEVFKPPYLFRGPRPRITHVQAGIAHGDTFKVTTPDASKVTSVVLSKLPSVTHLADLDQRTIELEFTKASNGTIEAMVPDNSAVALPGHYYLFLMSDNGEGPTPSRAAIVQIGETDKAAANLPLGR